MNSPSTVDNPPTPEMIRLEAGAVLDSVAPVVVGRQRDRCASRWPAVLAGGHVLIEDVPGSARRWPPALAAALGLDFRRVQFTPDLLPADITGSFVYDQRSRDFVFRAGPLFTGLLLADEINRTPPKTQSALLEAMQERQVTVEGRTFPLPEPFHVLATANPVEYEGTYPLPEAQLDRFLLRLASATRPPRRRPTCSPPDRPAAEEAVLAAVIDAERCPPCRPRVERVHVDEDVAGYCVDLAAATRAPPARRDRRLAAWLAGAAAGLPARSRCSHGRDYVLPEDVKEWRCPRSRTG